MYLIGLKLISSLLGNINPNKWTILHPTSKKCFMPTKCPELYIDGKALEWETITTCLCIFTDENVAWKTNINN